ncbi:porin [Lamprobacter modestohalophilus]|uniref:Porin n=1 Tax=Lamprobacter modestohalophilus TaxID=1064514 RepID=A0A9X0W6B1_9GAMM|nr:porin [Lamprobacter modestohalophilus]MBK1617616.1 porin [Lamprobacter modestohalophilus]MCF7977657.1 porin [Chromatiaceae bacterium]MCF8015880.1 porin [Chromatiaceae bacterium]
MQKKILTLAIAAAMVAPAAAMAEATLYGKLNMSIDYADVSDAAVRGTDLDGNPYASYYADPNGNVAAPGTIYLDAAGNPIVRGGQDFKGWGISNEGSFMPGASRANRIGVKGSEDLGNGLKAIYQVELGLNLGAGDDNIPSGNNGGISYRNSFIGLAGNWGTALVGRHDTPLKISTGKLDLFSDTMADYNGTVGFDDIRADNVIAYISPSFSGFSFMGAVVAGGGATAGSGANINEDSLAGAFSLAGIYNNGPFYASVAYESLDADMFMDSQTSLRGGAACIDSVGDPTPSCNYINDSYDKWRIGLGLLDWNGFTLTGIYEQQDNLPGGQQRSALTFIDANGDIFLGTADTVEKQSLWQIQAAYAFGNNSVKAMYGSVDRSNAGSFATNLNETISLNNLRDDLEGDRYTWAIGFDHNFSKRTKAYVLYTQVDDDLSGSPMYPGIEWSGFSAGMIHKF